MNQKNAQRTVCSHAAITCLVLWMVRTWMVRTWMVRTWMVRTWMVRTCVGLLLLRHTRAYIVDWRLYILER